MSQFDRDQRPYGTMEKSGSAIYELPAPVPQASRKKSVTRLMPYFILPLFIIFTFLKYPILYSILHHSEPQYGLLKSQCEQPDPLFPSSDNDLDEMYEYLSTDEFKRASIRRHSAAVQIPTESFDEMGPIGEDDRWEIMYTFQNYLKDTFPRVHQYMNPETVNTHGLLYTYEGSDDTLKPLLLLAHYDVVPVPERTIGAWTYPPYSGHYDGRFIWGRGASDCKNQLVAIMESMEFLLGAGYQPKRSIVLAFGFDEEVGGHRGAGHLAPFIHNRYGDGGIAAIVDEGAQFQKAWGSTFAVTGTGEKGNTDVHITVRMPGGHSSIPTDHTSIGVLSELLVKIEAEEYPTYLTDDNPYLGQLQCAAANSVDFPKKLKKLLEERQSNTCHRESDHLALEAAKQGRGIQYLMQTSQAITVIEGGVKSNALPERTSVTVNHRVNIGDEPEVVWDRLATLAKSVAQKYNLTLHAFDGVEEEPQSIALWHKAQTLRVAPVTPINVDRNTPYRIVAGTVRAVYGEEIIVSPGMSTGNTDTRYYWDLTHHIFRFGPGYDPE